MILLWIYEVFCGSFDGKMIDDFWFLSGRSEWIFANYTISIIFDPQNRRFIGRI